MKRKSCSISLGTEDHRPPREAPSQQRGIIHSVNEVMDDFVEADDVETLEMERLLCTTRVMNIYTDPICVLQHLCSAFLLMSQAHLYHFANLPRCLLKFHKDFDAVTFHPLSYDDVNSKVDYDRFPSANVKKLIALEDLGRGSTGKAWLCVTVTKPRFASCVLKFDNMHVESKKLKKELSMWRCIGHAPLFRSTGFRA